MDAAMASETMGPNAKPYNVSWLGQLVTPERKTYQQWHTLVAERTAEPPIGAAPNAGPDLVPASGAVSDPVPGPVPEYGPEALALLGAAQHSRAIGFLLYFTRKDGSLRGKHATRKRKLLHSTSPDGREADAKRQRRGTEGGGSPAPHAAATVATAGSRLGAGRLGPEPTPEPTPEQTRTEAKTTDKQNSRPRDLHYAELFFLIVDPGCRRSGVASQLVQEMLRRVRGQPEILVHEVRLHVVEKNVTAQRLYEKLGFTRGVFKKGYPQEHTNAWRMSMDLTAREAQDVAN